MIDPFLLVIIANKVPNSKGWANADNLLISRAVAANFFIDSVYSVVCNMQWHKSRGYDHTTFWVGGSDSLITPSHFGPNSTNDHLNIAVVKCIREWIHVLKRYGIHPHIVTCVKNARGTAPTQPLNVDQNNYLLNIIVDKLPVVQSPYITFRLKTTYSDLGSAKNASIAPNPEERVDSRLFELIELLCYAFTFTI